MAKGTGKTEYFLGLDVGSDAVGYAAAGEDYKLLKFRGEPMWGVHLFDAASTGEERRLFRTARRRIDRRQQRILWAQEIFAKEIAAVDPDFFLRIKESALFPEDSQAGVHLFGSREADGEYNRRYPTIHHLLCELMESDEGHDVRLVYLGCAWLLGHRGHFLPPEDAEGPCPVPAGMSVSRWKVGIYEQHREDLRTLKRLVRRYAPEKYAEMFRAREKGLCNYAAYAAREGVSPAAFGKYVRSVLKNAVPAPEDETALADVLARAGDGTFMPRQVGEDNRLLPNGVFAAELRQILERAAGYLPFLRQKDGDRYTPEEKLLAMMEFRIPYYVGPLRGGWMVRKGDGPIRPWNFEDRVDEDASEAEFIRRMTGQCTYLPGEDVLPKQSMIYQRFLVLNDINTLRVGGERISVAAKQRLFAEIFEKGKKATGRRVAVALGAESVEGMGEAINATLSTQVAFRNLLASGALRSDDVETIVARGTYTRDKARFKKWIMGRFPQLPEADVEYIAGQKFSDFGRLSRALLTELVGADKSSGEADTVLGWMWKRNVNLMELLSDKYTFAEQISEVSAEYYAGASRTLGERLDDMYVPTAAKRPIYRTLDVIRDVVKAMGQPPKRVFLQSTRGGTRDEKQLQSRYNRLKALYASCDAAAELRAELDAMEPERLQSDRVYLYFVQLGRCMYTGERIRPEELNSRAYNLDHIYPRSKVRDDSVQNNLILVRADVNRWKDDVYPIPEKIRQGMAGFWATLRMYELITAEKYSRLTRNTGFSPEEAWGFITRQTVQMHHSTKVLATLLKEHYPETEIVSVNGGLVNEFRREFDMVRCTSVNDLYHAKDAYLNIVVGNVWHERFTRQWFFDDKRGDYTVRVGSLFSHPVTVRGKQVWAGTPALVAVGNTVRNKNAVHLTRYAFCRTGGFFDQLPVAAKPGLVERKAGLPTEKYGGYTGLTVSYFLLVRYFKGKHELLELVPVRMMAVDRIRDNEAAAIEYAQSCLGAKARDVTLPLGLRPLKINTVFDLDGFRVTLRGISRPRVLVSTLAPLIIGYEWEKYVRQLDRFVQRRSSVPAGITPEKNLELYDILCAKLDTRIFDKRPANPFYILKSGRSKFEKLDAAEQAYCLTQIILVFSRVITGCDLRTIGGKRYSAVPGLSVSLKNWPHALNVRIVDSSASGLFESHTRKLLDFIFSD